MSAVANKRIDLAYNAIGQFSSIARYADLAATDEVATSTFTYDTLHRLTGIDYEKNSVDLFTPYSYSYDAMSRVTQMVNQDGTSDYDYDSTSQLTDADHTYQTDEAYSYDDNGNRTMTGYSTGTNNQLLGDGTYTYEYDDEGNRTKRTNTSTSETVEYAWDHHNRLTKITEKNSSGNVTKTVDYTYDFHGRRIAKAVGLNGNPPTAADTERYAHDGEHIALVFDGNGNLTNRILHGPQVDQVFADEEVTSLSTEGDTLWMLTDMLGSVRDVVSYDTATDTTTVENHLEYDAYGNVTSETNSAVDHIFGYTGRDRDEESELQFNRARYYDAAVGRWISEDPIGFEAGDTNVARYVANGATNATDPSGQEQAVEFWLKARIEKSLKKLPPDGEKLNGNPIVVPGGGLFGTTVMRFLPSLKQDLLEVGIAHGGDPGGEGLAGGGSFLEDVNDYDIHKDVFDLDDAVTQLREHGTRLHGRIDVLLFMDHGNGDDGQELGLEDLEPDDFKRFVRFLGKNPTIILGGCYVGRNRAYCQAIADATNASVIAADNFVGHEGREVEGTYDFGVINNGHWRKWVPRKRR